MRRKISYLLIAIGTVLLCIGIFTDVPGAALTTYQSMNGKETKDFDYIESRFSAIEEYVGGDAYNYIIGASLVSGKIAGAKAAKAIYISGGAIIISLGLFLIALEKEKIPAIQTVDTIAKTVSSIEKTNTI